MNMLSIMYESAVEQIKENLVDEAKVFYYNTKIFGFTLRDHEYVVRDTITDWLISGIIALNPNKDTCLAEKLIDVGNRYW